LVAAGLVEADRLAALEAVAARYAVSITPEMTALIDPDDGNDPIARQFVPNLAELRSMAEESEDPIGDDVHEVVPGLVHRYADRVLLKFTSVSVVYLEVVFAYFGAKGVVWVVVVSGGYPLIAAPRRLAGLTAALAEIDHVKVVRFHTRVPVVSPERVTGVLVEALKAPRTTTWVAVHANHPRELTGSARAALARLADAGIPLVSQTVLLRGVNDDPDTLGKLMRALVEERVKPYYLHHGDLAPGTGHFRTTIAEGQEIARAMRGRISGLCQPTYVLDIPGGHGKVPIGPDYLDASRGIVRAPDGSVHPIVEEACTCRC
jgi:lysine 2,3-aminomutase